MALSYGHVVAQPWPQLDVVQLAVRVKEATKPRKGRNPATGEEIMISAKPAAVTVKARPLAKAKAALPSVATARRRLAA